MRRSRIVSLAMLAAVWASTGFATAAAAPDLNLPGIAAVLRWIHAPPEYRLTASGIAITAPGKTDKYIHAGGGYAPDNAPLLVFDDTDREFIFRTAVSHPFASKYDSGGLVVEADSRHWFKFEFERDYTGAHRVVSVVTNDFSDDANAMSIDADSAYLQVARQGDAFYLYESRDGKSWYLVRTFHFQHAGPLRVGLIAQCPDGAGATITFSELRYRAGRVQDIWRGQ